MSVVTGIMLMLGASDWDESGIANVQNWLSERDWPPLKDVSGDTGGSKHPQFEAWGAGFNHFASLEDEFAAFVMSQPWRDPEDVLLVLNPEEGPMQFHRPSIGTGTRRD